MAYALPNLVPEFLDSPGSLAAHPPESLPILWHMVGILHGSWQLGWE